MILLTLILAVVMVDTQEIPEGCIQVKMREEAVCEDKEVEVRVGGLPNGCYQRLHHQHDEGVGAPQVQEVCGEEEGAREMCEGVEKILSSQVPDQVPDQDVV